MIAERLAAQLSRWNTTCTVQLNPDLAGWLTTNYPEWPHTQDFSQLSVITHGEEGWKMLHDGDDRYYLKWFTPLGIMDTPPRFIDAGLLSIGAATNGDLMVIDTRSGDGLALGFVSHELLLEDDPLAASDPMSKLVSNVLASFNMPISEDDTHWSRSSHSPREVMEEWPDPLPTFFDHFREHPRFRV